MLVSSIIIQLLKYLLLISCHTRNIHIRDSYFFFNNTATTEIYTLSLHDALPISQRLRTGDQGCDMPDIADVRGPCGDRKSTRLNSSHVSISYAVFCLKKKNINMIFRIIKNITKC